MASNMEIDDNLKKRLRRPRIQYTPSPASSEPARMKSSITITTSPPSLNPQKQLSFSTTDSSTIPEVNLDLSGLLDELCANESESGKLRSFVVVLQKIITQEIARFSETLIKENNELKARIAHLENELVIQSTHNKKRLDDQHEKILKVSTTDNSKDEVIVNLQKHVYRLEQYGRRNNVEFAGIPESYSDDDLEDNLIAVLKEIDVPVDKMDIEACHRLGRKSRNDGAPRRVIIRFVNRKFCYLIHKNKSKFKDLTGEQRSKLNLGNNKIYANYSLCKAYGTLWFNAKKLYAAGKIDGFWVSNGAIKINRKGETLPTLIEHQSDLAAVAPEFDFDDFVIPPHVDETPVIHKSDRKNKNKRKNKK